MRRPLIALLLSLAALAGTAGQLQQWPRPSAAPGAEPTDRLAVPEFDPPAASPRAMGPNAGWLAGIERDLAAREYHASVNHRGLQAPNRAQNLRTYFEPEGIRVTDRMATGEPELVRIRLAAVGREGALAAAGAARVSHDQARVELARGGLVEWYENSPAGLEQGFTLSARPAGEGPLVLDLKVVGAAALPDGDAVTFVSERAGGRLRYAKLAAFDASGAALPAHLEASGDRVRIVTDDRGAAYPVTIDPLITNTSDASLMFVQTNGQYGRSAASAGDVNGDGYGDVLVGAELFDMGQGNEGAAFLYLGGAAGIISGALPFAIFQSNVALGNMGRGLAAGDFNGDGYSDIVIGAYNVAPGVAYVFNGGPSGIASGNPATASATLSSDDAFSDFGITLACAGDVNGDGYEDLIIGASLYDNLNDGAAFVFHGSATGIASATPAGAATRLISTQSSSEFGWQVAGLGDINGDGYSDVGVSSPQYDFGQTNEGRVFIYHGSASGIPHGSQNTANGSIQSDLTSMQIGYSLSAAGDVNGDGFSDFAFGSPFYNGTNAGAVWVFHGASGGIGHTTILGAATRIDSNQGASYLGFVGALSSAGDVNGDGYGDLIVGAERYDSGQTDEGCAFVFVGGATGIAATTVTQAYARLESNSAGARLGYAVASAGDINGDGYDDVIAGAPLHGASDEGAAYLYLGGARGMSNGTALTADATIQSNQAAFGQSPELGRSVASAGDVNGDGVPDIIVGSAGYDLGEVDEGAAFVYLGGAFTNGTPANAHATLQGNAAGAWFGRSVAGAGDVNDDGYADVVVGAPGAAGGGAAYVFMGSSTGVASADPTTAATVLTSEMPDAELGCSVAGAGDIDGDGYADVIVGARGWAMGAGAAFIFRGGAGGVASATTAAAATRVLTGGIWNTGASVAGAGDVNGDGFADVIIGSPLRYDGVFHEGSASIFLGSAAGIPSGDIASANTTLRSNELGAWLGTSVAAAGDVNGDGYGDVIAGAPRHGSGNEGAAFVWYGGPSGVPSGTVSSCNLHLPGSFANGDQGASVACAGDLNGDGLADLIVGKPDPTNATIEGGAAYVYMGTRSTSATMAPYAVISGLQVSEFGASVAGLGDLDGDGFADVIVGAPKYNSPESDEGVAYLYHGGNAALGRPQHVNQRVGGAVPVLYEVQPWGRSYDGDGFRAGMTLLSAEGKKRVKLEVEHCPPGAAFGSGSCVRTSSPSWENVNFIPGSNGLPMVHELESVPAGLRRWRVRTLLAPLHVNQPGITAPPNPRHGPWRRLNAQVAEGDIRVMTGSRGEYRWNVAGGAWTTAGNWTPARIAPGPDDILVFDGTVTPTATVTNVPTQTIGQLRVREGARVALMSPAGVAVTLTIGGVAGTDLDISPGSRIELASGGAPGGIQITLPAGATGTCAGELAAGGGAHQVFPTDSASLVFTNGSSCETLPGFTGHLFGASGAQSAVVFRSGSTYTHNAGGHPFGFETTASRVVLETGNLFRLMTTEGASLFGRAYADFECDITPPIVMVALQTTPLPVTSFDDVTMVSGGISIRAQSWPWHVRGNVAVLPAGTLEFEPPDGSSNSPLVFVGTSPQTIGVEGSGLKLGRFSTLQVQNDAGLTLASDVFTGGRVHLLGGHLRTGPHLLHMGEVGLLLPTSEGWVIGNLGGVMPETTSTFTRTYYVGDEQQIAPATVRYSSIADSGTVVVRTDPGDHAELASSGLDPARSANRTWSVENRGTAFTVCEVTLHFDSTDVDAGADPNAFIVGRRDGGIWSLPAVGARTDSTTEATGLTAFGEFVVGEPVGTAAVDPIPPLTTGLAPARPSPFRSSTTLEFRLERTGRVELSIYGINGSRVRTLERAMRVAGVHRVAWDGRDDRGRKVPPGIYFSRLVTADQRHHRRVVRIE